MKTMLKNKDYVSIEHNKQISYGGSQEWFKAEPEKSYSRIQKGGCGIVAAADLFLYMKLCSPDLKKKIVDISSYKTYIRHMADEFISPGRIGVGGIRLQRGINKYLKKIHSDLRVHWRISSKDIIAPVRSMLEKDIPVILSVGPDISFRKKKRGVIFYRYSDGKYRVAAGPVNAHYVTVTGLTLREDDNDIMLMISSWGEKFYISYRQYRAYIKTQFFLPHVFSNILMLRHRHGTKAAAKESTT